MVKPEQKADLIRWREEGLTRHFSVTRVGLKVHGEPTHEDWAAAGPALGEAYSAVRLAIGDWLNYGKRYGEMYSQALDATGLEYGTLSTYAWVSRKVEFSVRNENLSWSHHKEVAPLEPAEQAEWLSIAEERRWSRDDLRTAIARTRENAGAPESLRSVTVEFRQAEEGGLNVVQVPVGAVHYCADLAEAREAVGLILQDNGF